MQKAIPSPEGVTVGYSGGPDSVVLADALRLATPSRPLSLLMIDHQNRDISKEIAQMKRHGDQLNALCRVVPVAVEETGNGWEDAARKARYHVFDKEEGTVALGHTASDQAETVLMRLIRGDNWRSLSGIPKKRGSYVRPLFEFSRQDILNYAAERGLHFSLDPSNQSRDYFRNRVRHEILPILRRENPSIDDGLINLARDISSLRAVVEQNRPATDRLDIHELPADDVMRAAILSDWIQACGRSRPSRESMQQLLKLTSSSAGSKNSSIPGLRRHYNELRWDHEISPPPVLKIAIAPKDSRLRLVQPGDRFRPHRLKGRSKKLSDLYAESKVSRWRRSQMRVLAASDGRLLWAEEVGLAYGVSSTEVDVHRSDGY